MPALDLSQDYLVWDNPEAITVEVRTLDCAFGTSEGDTFAVPTAKRRALTWKELAASGGAYTGQDTVWQIPQAVLPAGRPLKVGDQVIDADSTRYTALDVSLGKWKQTWRLTTRNLAIAYGLRDTIDIQRAEVGYDQAGATVRTFPPAGGRTIYAGLVARVQLVSREETDERGLRGLKALYQITIARAVSLVDEDRILWNGKYLDIKKYTQADRIDVLPVIDAELAL